MNAPQQRVLIGSMMAIIACMAVVLASHAQQPQHPAQPTKPNATPAAKPAAATMNSTDQASIDAQREQIWNSPNMLRARAWLQDYCHASAKITPDEAQQYMTDLQNLSPSQMRLWLLKFDQEEESRQQQHSMWDAAHAAALSRAKTADKATQQAYANVEKGENQAAGEAQQQVNEQEQAAQSMQESKQIEDSGPYGPYGYGGYGGVHYHFHLYPY
jgi:hypothetical protein